MPGESTCEAALPTVVFWITGASKHWIAEFTELCNFGLLFDFMGCPSFHIGSSMHMWRLAPLLLAVLKLPRTAAVSSWMARLYGSWPWVHGHCEECRPETLHDSDWIVRCTQCLRGFCDCHTVDGCSICGYPYCHNCIGNHVCQRDALLRKFPELQCRFCDRPQDTGNGQSRCEHCLKSACIGSPQCRSQIETTHCRCRGDLCAECASWFLVARVSRRRIADLGLGYRMVPVPIVIQRYLCNDCSCWWRLQWALQFACLCNGHWWTLVDGCMLTERSMIASYARQYIWILQLCWACLGSFALHLRWTADHRSLLLDGPSVVYCLHLAGWWCIGTLWASNWWALVDISLVLLVWLPRRRCSHWKGRLNARVGVALQSLLLESLSWALLQSTIASCWCSAC